MLFSVIVPVHNKKEFVSDSLKSILNQNFEDYEILVIDDASTDGSSEIICSFSDSRMRFAKRDTPGGGGYAARNLGIEMAKGEWILFLDADDVYCSGHLAAVKYMIDAYPEANLISAARVERHGQGERLDAFSRRVGLERIRIVNAEEYLRYAASGLRALGTNSVCIRRSSLPVFSIFPDGRTNRSGDLYTWILLVVKCGPVFWSPHQSAVLNRDTIGVSRNSLADVQFLRSINYEFESLLSEAGKKSLTRYVNSLIKGAWVESSRRGVHISPFHRLAFWRRDFFYVLRWSLILIIPVSILEYFRTLARKIKLINL